MRQIEPHPRLCDLLLPAFKPCQNFGACPEAIWKPEVGHVPRGFLGACGGLNEVKAILVFAEPGGVYPTDSYPVDLSPEDLLRLTVDKTYRIMAASTDQFHRNLRWFLDQIIPETSFEQQLRQVWLTEGRLCSVAREIGGKRDRRCADLYLGRQIALLPQAVVVGFGGKAQAYLSALKLDHVAAYALSPPGANHRPARPSWAAAAKAVLARHSDSGQH